MPYYLLLMLLTTCGMMFPLVADAATLTFRAIYTPSTGNISIVPYDSDGQPWSGVASLASIDIQSKAGYFTRDAPQFPTKPSGASIITSADSTQVAWQLFDPADPSSTPSISVTYETPYDFGDIAQTGLTQAIIDTDFFGYLAPTGGSFAYTTATGTDIESGKVVAAPVPEPSAGLTAAIASAVAACCSRRQRRLLRHLFLKERCGSDRDVPLENLSELPRDCARNPSGTRRVLYSADSANCEPVEG